MSASDTQAKVPRVCVCVMMNHPFPKNIPILREIYAGRFDKILFLIPFERSDELDVITVYRGSYSHAGYISDAYHSLRRVDCDHFLFVHDDVLLNPRLSLENFYDTFTLGLDDGFIADAGCLGEGVGSWSWAYRFFASLAFPKSMLFGSGVEANNLKRYLPDGEALRARLRERGVHFQDFARFSTQDFDDVKTHAAEVLLNGLSERLPPGPLSDQIAADCLDVELRLTAVMAKMLRMRDPDTASGSSDAVIRLPFPVLSAGFYADCYIVPKSRLSDYAHYVGVAAAGELFVEIMVPTLLHQCCEKVWTASELGLEFAFFNTRVEIHNFTDDRFVALHPYKLSTLSNPGLRSAFFETVGALRRGDRLEAPLARPGASRLNPYLDNLMSMGWHFQESWGRWASKSRASIDFLLPPDGSVTGLRLKLKSPTANYYSFTGSLIINKDISSQPFIFPFGTEFLEVTIPASGLTAGAVNVIDLISDKLVPVVSLDPTSQDLRSLGVGLVECTFV